MLGSLTGHAKKTYPQGTRSEFGEEQVERQGEETRDRE